MVSLSFEYNTAVIGKKLQYCLFGVWLIVSVGMSAWGFWPRAFEYRNLIVPGFGEITLEWNPDNRNGDISVIKLTLVTKYEESLPSTRQPLSGASYSYLNHHPEVNLAKKINKVVEARLEIPAVDMKPHDIVRQSFQPGEEVVFYWNVISHSEGEFQGRIWLYIGNRSLVGDFENRYPIAVQSVDLQWRDLFGINGTAARFIGLFNLIAGILLVSLLWYRASRRIA